MKKANGLRQRAEGYRRMRTLVSVDRAGKALDDLADESEMTAAELEKRHHTRERAHQIWVERGRPEGREVEFWLDAEKEVADEPRSGPSKSRRATAAHPK
jgi:hypothetical protein